MYDIIVYSKELSSSKTCNLTHFYAVNFQYFQWTSFRSLIHQPSQSGCKCKTLFV